MTSYLTIEDALFVLDELGLPLRDLGLLEGAIARPASSAFGKDAYQTLELKIAALIDAINRSHPLIDGNKRLSWVCSVVFARLNEQDLAAPQKEIDRVIRAVASGKADLNYLAGWVQEHLEPLHIN